MIYDPRSLDSWCISGSDESLFGWVLSVNHDPRDPQNESWSGLFSRNAPLSPVKFGGQPNDIHSLDEMLNKITTK